MVTVKRARKQNLKLIYHNYKIGLFLEKIIFLNMTL